MDDVVVNPWASTPEPPATESAATDATTVNDLWNKWESLSGKSSPKTAALPIADEANSGDANSGSAHDPIRPEIHQTPLAPVPLPKNVVDFEYTSTSESPARLSLPSERPMELGLDADREAVLSHVLELQDSLKGSSDLVTWLAIPR